MYDDLSMIYKDIEQYTMIYDTACKGLAVGEPDEAGKTGQFCCQLCMKPHSSLFSSSFCRDSMII